MKNLIKIELLLVLLLSSCLVGKKYERPEIAVPETYASTDSTIVVQDTIINLQWFQLFEDKVLNSLIQQALDTNINLKNAALRVQQARLFYLNSKANLLPSVGYKGTADINNGSDNDYFQALGTASWEIDFWGKLRHAKRAAYGELIATEEGLKTVKTTLVSDMANLYFLMRDLDNRIAVSEKTLESRAKYYNLVNERFIKGESSELDKLQAEQQLAIVQASLKNLQRELHITERSINILLAQNPQPVPRGLENSSQTSIPEIPAGMPSSLLEQRPDVKAAENLLLAETEKIGMYQAMRLPSFSITGYLGLASPDINTLAESMAGNLTGMIIGPLFEFGKNKRRVDIQKAEAEIAINTFMDTWRRALADVENSIISISTLRDEVAARSRQAQAARKALMLTQAKYDEGYSDYLEVLIAESYAYDADMILSVTRAAQLGATVSLYRALGGGW